MITAPAAHLFQHTPMHQTKTVAPPIQAKQEIQDKPELEDNSDSDKEGPDSDDDLFDGAIKKVKGLQGKMAAQKDRIHTVIIL
ncbi:hypothetical protein PtA15_3A433 [Puccinia triticina]|uniref:Uncharacterized protein n=1 Tax=Puccinia triticina TaxID=208348 RepID=A0ABY7CFZ5_9BASI|nr:uncharacterized protein PtA15_3A433 [Puccinia triticina]WAQ83066.1 hypothetical protein PtA15_3A433 [Puccinia triticina]WAR53901.1 hypothetical protein PtB15_3B410 [Puccinia triticina]